LLQDIGGRDIPVTDLMTGNNKHKARYNSTKNTRLDYFDKKTSMP
jgi:hypothetical protein